ncbi:MAG: hypothetical protein JXB24_07675 [Bacteroidales bacterium]|nr:hypothetical protein [Bacteroidales bacterium]
MAYQLTWHAYGVYIRYLEVLTFQDLIRAQGKLLGDRRYDMIQYEIDDFTAVKTHQITVHEAQLIGKMDKAASIYHQKKQHILVYNQQEYSSLVNKYIEALADTNWEVHVFETLKEAHDHLKKLGIFVET